MYIQIYKHTTCSKHIYLKYITSLLVHICTSERALHTGVFQEYTLKSVILYSCFINRLSVSVSIDFSIFEVALIRFNIKVFTKEY
jgi:hypothetical protein